MIRSTPTPTRELPSRAVDGIHVHLMWSACDGHLWVLVVDHKSGTEFTVDVRDRERALDVFHHPYVYAAHQGVDTGAPAPALAASAVAA